VGLHLVHGEFELPAGVVGGDHLLGRGEVRVEKRGDQATLYPMAGAVGILQGVADQAHHNRGSLPPPTLLPVGRPPPPQENQPGAVGERANRQRFDRGGQAPEKVGPAGEDGFDHLEAVEPTIP
jgi:hypothetical protein